MANIIKHSKTTVPPKVTITDFAAEHTFAGGNLGALIYRDTAQSDGANWLNSVAVNQVLVSGGVGAAPAWSATPTLTSLTTTNVHTFLQAAIASTSTDGAVLTNTTASTAGVPVQMSPRSRWSGTAWNSTALTSETNSFFAEVLPTTVAGTTTAKWRLGYIAPNEAVTYPYEVNSVGTISSALTSATVPQYTGPQAQGTGISFSPNANNIINFLIDNSLKWQIDASGHLRSGQATSAIGYAVGGTVTQQTNKATSVTLSKVTGEITMNSASLAADTTVSFTLTNTVIAVDDQIFVTHVSAGTLAAYSFASTAAAGSAVIAVHNTTPGALAEAIVLKFVVFKAATT